MNQPIQVLNNKVLNIVDGFPREFCRNSFFLLKKSIFLAIQLMIENLNLLFIVCFAYFLKKLFYIVSIIIKGIFYMISSWLINKLYFFLFDYKEAIISVSQIESIFKLILKLFAPFRQNSQNGRAFDWNVLTFDLFLCEVFCVLGYFPPDQERRVLFDFVFVFLCFWFFFGLFLFFFRWRFIIGGVHPSLIIRFFKCRLHQLRKFFVIRDGICIVWWWWSIASCHDFVQKLHN